MKKILSIGILTLCLVGFSNPAKADFCSSLEGLSLYSKEDKQFLGTFTDKYDSESIFNKYGDYGSKYEDTSIFNKYGDYGSKYEDTSPWNKYADEAPLIIDDKFSVYGMLTLNKFADYTPIHPMQAITCYYSLSEDILEDFIWSLDEFDGYDKINSKSDSGTSFGSTQDCSGFDSSDWGMLQAKICEDKRITDQYNQIERQKYLDSLKLLEQQREQEKFAQESASKVSCPANSYYSGTGTKCLCNEGYGSYDGSSCVKKPTTTTTPSNSPTNTSSSTEKTICASQHGDASVEKNGVCTCSQKGYDWTPWGYCAKRDYVADKNLTNKLTGKIILQVESNGEAYYIPKKYQSKFYLKDGSAAYEALRKFGLGITDSDLEKIPVVTSTEEMKTSTPACNISSLGNKLKGEILLQVQKNGEAWYIDPNKCRRIYMKNGEEAYKIMRFLSLGITNKDLDKIPTGNINQLPK